MAKPYPPNADANVQGGVLRGHRDFVFEPDYSAAGFGSGLVAAQQKQHEQPKRTPQIAESLKRLDACLDDLASAMSALLARLEPTALIPPADQAAGQGASAPAPVRCGIAQQIEAQTDRLRATTALLRDILDRLEV